MVAKPRTIDLDDLFKQVQFEERVYRHRCVEAWAMTVPWTGFPLSQLVKICRPAGLGEIRRVPDRAGQPKNMPGLDSPFYPWPYIEGLAIDEAANDLAFISTGMYGKPLPPQNGGPIRLTMPWKYGFKSAKALVKISFTDKRPVNFWQAIAPSEYGFWANVNPAVAHPRWSQAQERLIGTSEMVPTQIYNGYGDFVASLYADRTKREAVHVTLQRILAVLAAALLVGAVALATLGPPVVAARPGCCVMLDRDATDARARLRRTASGRVDLVRPRHAVADPPGLAGAGCAWPDLRRRGGVDFRQESRPGGRIGGANGNLGVAYCCSM